VGRDFEMLGAGGNAALYAIKTFINKKIIFTEIEELPNRLNFRNALKRRSDKRKKLRKCA